VFNFGSAHINFPGAGRPVESRAPFSKKVFCHW
jgi:hypothetical protein